MYALTQAMNWCEKHLKTDATIYTDSRSSTDAIKNPSSHQLVTSVQKSLDVLLRRHQIKLVWVKAHVVIVVNEEADVPDRYATSKHSASCYNLFPISLAKSKIRDQMWNEWASEYETARQGEGTGLWLPKFEDVKHFFETSETSFELTQVMTGHGFNKKNLNRFKICDGALCPCDDTSIQSIEHLIKECPKYAIQRDEYKRFCSILDATPYNLASNDAKHFDV